LTSIDAFSEPVYVTAPPGDTHRLFVVQKDGQIKLIKDGGSPSTFLNISNEVQDNGEQGLLSMAFAPDFAASHKLYVYYTSKTCPDAPGCDEHVSEFTASSSDAASASTEHALLTIPHPTDTNHNGGQLQFGPDGDLYISVGDGGGSYDTHGNAQLTNTLLGKILRIAPTGTIPTDNPFGGNRVWAYGLRNPWRFSFDSATGATVIGDVGQDNYEEIDYAPRGRNAGANYGWPCYEGFNALCSSPPAGAVFPVLAYPHPGDCGGAPFCGKGVIGGYVMHDPRLPSLEGCYVYGDLGNTHLRVAGLAQPRVLSDADLGPTIQNLSTFGVDAQGRVYAADVSGGGVYRLDPDGNPATSPGCIHPPAPPSQPQPGGTSNSGHGVRHAAPQLTSLRLTPRRFKPARRGASIVTRGKTGALLTFRLSERVAVAFSIDRRRTGRKQHGRCRPASGSNRRGGRCTLWSAVKGSFRITGEAGLNRLRFTGRLGRKALAPGTYRLDVRARDATGSRSKLLRVAFVLHR
jgi:Glucose / Sorbosone dehydrogenase